MTNNNNNREEEIEDWRNEHGELDLGFLRSLANVDNIEAVRK